MTDPSPTDAAPHSTAPPPITPAPRSRARMLELVFPKDTNYLGTAFGGWVLSLMDKAASVAAVRHGGGNVVTARMDGVDFRLPIRVGDAVALDAQVVRVGRSSMTVRVDVYRETMTTGEQALATTGTFVFVAVDEAGKPCPVPPLPEGQETPSAQPDHQARP
ncbi:acyl-CoA thioesterase [Deinococcus marmoris]